MEDEEILWDLKVGGGWGGVGKENIGNEGSLSVVGE